MPTLEGTISYILQKQSEIHGKAIPGRICLQKLLYFAKQKKVPLRVSFGMHERGPYSSELAYRIDDWIGQRIIQIARQAGAEQFVKGQRAEEYISKEKEDLDKWAHALDEVVKKYGNRPVKELDFLATVHFLARMYRDVHGLGDAEEVRKRIITHWSHQVQNEEIGQQLDKIATELVGAALKD